MTSNNRICAGTAFKVAAVLSGLMAAACTPRYAAEPKQVDSSKPSVTYRYHNDEELIEANGRAQTFCAQYQQLPETASVSTDSSGAKVVKFNCATPAPARAVLAPANPNLNYTYRTDQGLLDASRSAQAYCMTQGMHLGASNTAVNADGSKTVSFQCTAP